MVPQYIRRVFHRVSLPESTSSQVYNITHHLPFILHQTQYTMPGLLPKHVRFAYQNSFHSPPTPTLSFSSSTMSSDSAPVTPPYATQSLPGPSRYPSGYSPYKKARSPSYSEPIRCHPLLKTAALTWDLLDHPSTARYNYKSIPHRMLSEPATFPSLSYMKISSPHLPWSIEVYASNGSFVSLEDVLDAVYQSLRINIKSSEFDSLPSSNDRRSASRAYEHRYRRQRSSIEYDKEKKGGMKRIDFLMGHTRFLRISNSSRIEEWHLDIA